MYRTVCTCTEKYTHSLPIYRLGVINQCLATKIHARVLFVFLLSFNLNSLSLYYHSTCVCRQRKGSLLFVVLSLIPCVRILPFTVCTCTTIYTAFSAVALHSMTAPPWHIMDCSYPIAVVLEHADGYQLGYWWRTFF